MNGIFAGRVLIRFVHSLSLAHPPGISDPIPRAIRGTLKYDWTFFDKYSSMFAGRSAESGAQEALVAKINQVHDYLKKKEQLRIKIVAAIRKKRPIVLERNKKRRELLTAWGQGQSLRASRA
jgi:hypothetical protein